MGTREEKDSEASEHDSAGQALSEQRAQFATVAEQHAAGVCKPCIFIKSMPPCPNGDSCPFCHEVHTRKDRQRPCRVKRERQRRLLERASEMRADGVQSPAPEVPRRTI